ncbi:uncharacterized protein LOC126595476 [Malus sylvestris]|uniref:uncharacterized protein LOC126595476 n=1 Tax=Malus sylvestris TaxID=3752 RepID=UPI0021ACD5AF|nr:uncharacterized protein LOC126595476 [Malus sylvestris]
MESPSPTNKVQLQRLLGKINFLKRFIANLAGKIQPLTPLLRPKDKENFEWGPPHQEAFDDIKAYLTSPPVLVPPQRGNPLKLYISASDKSIGSLLAQNNEGGKEQAMYYLRRIGKWIITLSEFSFQYVPQRAVKGQAIADFLAEHQESRDEIINIPGTLEVTNVWIPPGKGISGKDEWIQQEIRRVAGLWITSWKLYFDGSYTQKASGARIVIINPQGIYHYYSFLLDYQGNTNNRAEYEALIIGLEILMDLGAMEVEVFGDSELVINQLNEEFNCRLITMARYNLTATQLLSYWDSDISVSHVPRGANLAANEMAQLASGMPIQEKRYGLDVEIQRRNLPSILEKGFSLDVMVQETEIEDWRSPIIHHLKYPFSKKNRQQATKYVLWAKDLLRKTPDGLLLKCLGQEESMRVMAKVHEGVCGAHQARTKMRWLLRRYGYFWPDMEKDCKSYARGCEECQRHSHLQHVPSVPLNPVVKPWPFRGWAMDFIGHIYPASSKGHTFIIVAMDYFTKWVEASAAYITSKRAGTGTTPYALTFGQDAMLPIEINVSSVRIQNQFGLHSEEYIEAMCQGIKDLDVARIEALNQIQEGKRAVARAYNKIVKEKSYKEGDLVWKTVLPLGAQLRGFGKWSPTWEGPFMLNS